MRPILVGPFHAEPGVEVLYWLPYLNHLRHRYKVTPNRLHVVTRGGAGVWYGVPPSQVLDLYTLRPVEEVRQQSHRAIVDRGTIKQTTMTAWDRNVLDQAAGIWGLERPIIWHPSRLSMVFDGFWREQASLQSVWSQTVWNALPAPTLSAPLPPHYVAMRWYVRSTLQAHPDHARQIAAWVQALATHVPVIWLENPHHLDDHVDLPPPPGVTRLDPVPPAQTLAQHTAILAGCSSFVGTYGGMAQLALRLKKPALSFYDSLQGTFLAHLVLSQAVAARTGVPFYAVKIADLPLWSRMLVPKA